jgi:hypothetical protein
MAGFKHAKEISKNVVQLFDLLNINCFDLEMKSMTQFSMLTIESILNLALPYLMKQES